MARIFTKAYQRACAKRGYNGLCTKEQWEALENQPLGRETKKLLADQKAARSRAAKERAAKKAARAMLKPNQTTLERMLAESKKKKKERT